MRIIGVDYGDKRTGIALGDTETKIATPWATLESRDRQSLVNDIRGIMKKERVLAVVVGVPYSMSGEENEQVAKTKEFIRQLTLEGMVVHQVDERLTSRLAATQARESGTRGGRDDLAAANILQTWLLQYGVSS